MSECNECNRECGESKEEYIFASEAPYPPVQVCGKNPAYAREMLSNIGSCGSELSAVTRYFYNSVITGDISQDIGKTFHRISIVEMHHLQIFASLAKMLGADPRPWSPVRNRMVYWNASCNQYPEELEEILRYSYREETATIKRYEWQIEHIQDQYIQENLRRIILDEKCHLVILDQLYEKYC